MWHIFVNLPPPLSCFYITIYVDTSTTTYTGMEVIIHFPTEQHKRSSTFGIGESTRTVGQANATPVKMTMTSIAGVVHIQSELYRMSYKDMMSSPTMYMDPHPFWAYRRQRCRKQGLELFVKHFALQFVYFEVALFSDRYPNLRDLSNSKLAQ